MTIEFTRDGKTYQCAVGKLPDQPPPATLQITFRPCTLKPPMMLSLAWLATDEIRAVELYQPSEVNHE